MPATADRLAPGTLVDYHGSLADLHGTYEAQPCSCRRCFAEQLADLPNAYGLRYALWEPGATGPGAVYPRCVRRRSITPL
ncbi:hypothetical protein ACN20G_28055 (plasmid) [Streptomyces sp. BI20]|uniref:hypothetical protein n=1 Tax=Streptomyces sp. BI20 TaxID=3403460 RepID=UPI003C735E51